MSDTDSSYLTEYNTETDTDFTTSSNEIVIENHIDNVMEIIELDEIYYNDAYSLVECPAENHYYIATYKYMQNGLFIFAKSVSPDTFFKYPFETLVRYLYWFSLIWIPPNPKVEIILIKKWGNQSICILKTHWIRIIQRCWRRVYKERQLIIAKRKRLQTIREVEMGKYPVIPFPDLRGMLAKLKY